MALQADVIYTTLDEDIGVLKNFSMDFEANFEFDGANDFQITLAQDNNCLEIGQYIYMNGTEYGGRIDKLKVITNSDEIFYTGRNWRGILASKTIEPYAGQPYYIVSDDVTDVLTQIISDIELTDVFSVKEGVAKQIDYQFKRYCNAYDGIQTMLSSNGLKLMLAFNEATRKCEIWAENVIDFSQTQNITSDLYDFTFEKNTKHPNHIIGLGRGHLEERDVVHLYLDEDNEISTTQTFFGADEIVYTYDYGNVDSHEELVEASSKKLLDMLVADKISIIANDLKSDIGDKFSVFYELYGIKTIQYISTIIVDIDDYRIKTSYKADTYKEAIETEIEEIIEKDIPTKTSDLINDSEYQTASEVEQKIDTKIASVYRYKGSVATVADLPSGATEGDVYNVVATGVNYAWTGTDWDALGGNLNDYLPLSGGTMTGAIIYPTNKTQVGSPASYGADLKNSDIIGVNGIYMADESTSPVEGINFYRDGSRWDGLYANAGVLYFVPNFKHGETQNRYAVILNQIEHYGNAQFTYNSGFKAYSTVAGNNDEPKATKFGRIVNLTGAFNSTTAQSSSDAVYIGKVPTGCEPLYKQTIRQQGSGQDSYLFEIFTDGRIRASRYGTTSAIAIPNNAWLNINATYISNS